MTSKAGAVIAAPKSMAGITQDISSIVIDRHSRGAVGTFNAPVYLGNQENLNDVLSTLPTAVDAPFNAYQRRHDPTCLSNTRVDLLRDIYSWADGQDERCIFWLNGLAGTGKSTIARTVARRYLDQKRLGASFFFSRGGGDVGHAGKFVTSIALQLASSVPSLDQYVCDAIKERRDIASQSLRDQWQQLVIRPLSKLSGSGGHFPYILVIDALDECDNDKDIRIIVHLLAEARSLKTARVRVFLTSRPEVPIRNGFGEVPDREHRDFVLHNISPPIVDHDISLFLQHNFKLIREEQSLDIEWPGAEIIKQLVQIAGSLFIWAATACRFIQEGLFADERVQTLLEGSTCTTAPEEHLNELYTTVLRRSVHPRYSATEKKALHGMLRHIIGSIVVLFSPLSASSLHRLLDVAKHKINQVLKDLHAILDVPKADAHPLRLHHPSFRDFLLEPKRCADRDFLVDEKQAHQILADRCIQLMSKSLKQDICGVDAPGMLVADVERSLIEQGLPPEVQYACSYWTDHVQKSATRLRDNGQVHVFLQKHLLHWLEALGWMGKISGGVHAIAALESFVSSSECPGIWSFVHDAKRFVLYNRAAIEQAPLQTYGSALVFAPTSSIIRENFEYCIPRWIQKLPRVENEWNTLLQALEGHAQSVNAVTFSPDGKMLASASSDTTVKLWDAASGALLQTLEGHSASVHECTFLPNSKSLISISTNGEVSVWNSGTGELLLELSDSTAVNSAVSRYQEAVRLSGTLAQLISNPSTVYVNAISPDGKMLASVIDKEVMVWETNSGREPYRLQGFWDSVKAMVFSQDGKMLALVLDKGVTVWDTELGTQLCQVRGLRDSVKAINFSQGGEMLASVSDRDVMVCDPNSGSLLYMLGGLWDSVKAVIFSQDGKMLALVSDEEVTLWGIYSGAELHKLSGHLDSVYTVVFSQDGSMLALASSKTVRLWEVSTGKVIQTLDRYARVKCADATSLDGKLRAEGSDSRVVKLWNIVPGGAFRTLEGHSDQVTAVDFSPDTKLLASASKDRTVRLWDTSIKPALPSLDAHWDYVTILTFSPDGMFLASAANDCTVKLWDTDKRVLLRNLTGHSGHVSAMIFSPDSKLLASASADGTICLRKAAEGAVVKTLKGHSARIIAMAFSPDGKTLASASGDKAVKLWDTAMGKELKTLQDHSDWVNTVGFTPDGKTLASASNDKTVKLWNAASGALLQTLEGHSSSVNSVAFSPDGKTLASASSDKTVKLWDAALGALLQTLEGYSGAINSVAFSPDNKMLHTNRGTLSISALSSGTSDAQTLPPDFISIEEHWVHRRTKRILWLPPDHRPSVTTVQGSTIGFGYKSGRVTIIELAP